MIDPAPDRLGVGAPFNPVVEGATGEEQEGCQGKDPQS